MCTHTVLHPLCSPPLRSWPSLASRSAPLVTSFLISTIERSAPRAFTDNPPMISGVGRGFTVKSLWFSHTRETALLKKHVKKKTLRWFMPGPLWGGGGRERHASSTEAFHPPPLPGFGLARCLMSNIKVRVHPVELKRII